MRTLADAIAKITATLDGKGADYGPTHRRVCDALNLPPCYSNLVRILEKVMRINHLLTISIQPREEAFRKAEAEFLDIAGYAILSMFEMNGKADDADGKPTARNAHQQFTL